NCSPTTPATNLSILTCGTRLWNYPGQGEGVLDRIVVLFYTFGVIHTLSIQSVTIPMPSRPHTLELALLGFLRPEPKHAYAIHQELSSPTGLGPVWQVNLSQLYALLGKLQEAGYLLATSEPQENRPPRKVFHLTDDGRE